MVVIHDEAKSEYWVWLCIQMKRRRSKEERKPLATRAAIGYWCSVFFFLHMQSKTGEDKDYGWLVDLLSNLQLFKYFSPSFRLLVLPELGLRSEKTMPTPHWTGRLAGSLDRWTTADCAVQWRGSGAANGGGGHHARGRWLWPERRRTEESRAFRFV